MSFRKFVVLLPALLVAACTAPQVAPTVGGLRENSGYAHGIDLATDTSDVIGEMRGRPWLQFVARYYRDPASRWPALSPSEAQRLSALGVKIVTVWEWHSSDPSYFTYATGYNDALSAARQAKTVGQPRGTAIYFAVDFNARDAALYQVDQYFRGVNAGLAAADGGRPEYRIGVYGSGAVCAAVRGAGLAQYAWLSGSASWDGTAGYNGWNIRQAAAGARFGNLSFNHDANEAKNDYGGFQIGNYAGMETPAAAIVTAAAVAPAAAATVVSNTLAAVAPPPSTPAPPPPAPLTLPAPAVARAAPLPPQPAPAIAKAAPLSPPPAAPVMAAVAPPPVRRAPSASAAEVAALAAAEPAAAASVAHAAKASAPKRKAYAVAANNRALAAPLRHLGGAVAATHHAEHKASAPHRSEEHAAPHVRHTAEQRHPEKPRHEKAS